MLVNATRTSAPAAEPVSVELAKLHMREDLVDSANDAYIHGLIEAARDSLETRLSLCLCTTTWVSKFMDLPADYIQLPLQPVQSVTSITYKDQDGAAQTLDTSLYTVNNWNFPTRIRRVPGAAWPIGTEVVVTYEAGYGDDPATVPAALRQWVVMAVTDMYRYRSTSTDKPAVPQQFAQHLLDPFYPYEV